MKTNDDEPLDVKRLSEEEIQKHKEWISACNVVSDQHVAILEALGWKLYFSDNDSETTLRVKHDKEKLDLPIKLAKDLIEVNHKGLFPAFPLEPIPLYKRFFNSIRKINPGLVTPSELVKIQPMDLPVGLNLFFDVKYGKLK